MTGDAARARSATAYLVGTWLLSAAVHVYIIVPASVLPRVATSLGVTQTTAVWLISAVLVAWAGTNFGVGVVIDSVGDYVVDDLRNELDGCEIGRAFNRSCPSCGQEHTAGDRLVVTAGREKATWTGISIVCADCGDRSLSTGPDQPSVERALVGIDLVATPMKLVLDGDSAEMLDYTPAKHE